jgi:preprotein translocase subunit SecG
MLHALMIFQAVVSILLIILVLLQFGKGAEAGLISSGGASDAAFSSAQRGNILSKITTVLSVIFLAGAVNLARIQSKGVQKSLMDTDTEMALPLSSKAPANKKIPEVPKTPTAPAKK